MNLTADLVAEALYGIEMLKDKICRIYSTTREDIFNVKIKELPEWSIIYKMLFDEEKMNIFTYAATEFDDDDVDEASMN